MAFARHEGALLSDDPPGDINKGAIKQINPASRFRGYRYLHQTVTDRNSRRALRHVDLVSHS